MNTVNNKPPLWFWVVSSAALLWNIMGLLAFIAQTYSPKVNLDNLTEAEKISYAPLPTWVFIAFAIAVFSGLAGCIALLLKKHIAYKLLIMSFLGIMVQNFYTFYFTDALNVFKPSELAIPLTVIIVAILLIFFSKYCLRKNWIR